MAKLIAKEGGVDLDPGTYTVIVRKVEDVDGQYGPQVKIELEVEDVVDVNGDEIKLLAWASQKLTPASKLWSWFDAFGIAPELDTEYDTKLLLNKRCQALIVESPTKQGGTTSKIDSLFPMPRSGAQRGRQAPVETSPVAITAESTISDWWTVTRNRGWSRPDVLALAGEMYGKEPADMEPEERVLLLESIKEKATA